MAAITPELILASASPRRRQLMKEAGLKFKVLPSHVSEDSMETVPSKLVRELALRKALATANKRKTGLVIGADTIVVLKGEVIGKFDVKSWIPGRSSRAVVVIDKAGKIAYHKIQAISLFRPKDDDILEAIKQAG